MLVAAPHPPRRFAARHPLPASAGRGSRPSAWHKRASSTNDKCLAAADNAAVPTLFDK